MISLQPQTTYQIVRQLPDPSDSTTYYVQAKIRRCVDDTVLQTINLTDLGSRRFKGSYTVPADSSGVGFYIDITTTVYTDSGYTTKSTTYSEELEQYLVWDRVTKLGGGGGGGSDIDYKKIQKMLDLIKTDFPKIPPADYSPILKMLSDIKSSVESIEMPEEKNVEFKPVIDALKATETMIIKAIDEKEFEFEPTDLTPIMDKIEDKDVDLSGVEGKLESIEKMVKEDYDEKKGTRELQKLADILKPFLGGKEEKTNEKDPLTDKVKKLID